MHWYSLKYDLILLKPLSVKFSSLSFCGSYSLNVNKLWKVDNVTDLDIEGHIYYDIHNQTPERVLVQHGNTKCKHYICTMKCFEYRLRAENLKYSCMWDKLCSWKNMLEVGELYF